MFSPDEVYTKWENCLADIFPNGVPFKHTWYEINEIVKVLDLLCSYGVAAAHIPFPQQWLCHRADERDGVCHIMIGDVDDISFIPKSMEFFRRDDNFCWFEIDLNKREPIFPSITDTQSGIRYEKISQGIEGYEQTYLVRKGDSVHVYRPWIDGVDFRCLEGQLTIHQKAKKTPEGECHFCSL